MPAIPQENIDQINNGEADGPSREAIEGFVVAKLIEAEETDPNEESGYAGQNLKFEVISPRKHKGSWIWEYMSYHPKATFKWRDFFDAVDYDYDSDTTEIIEEEEEFVLECEPEMQQKGKNKGKFKTKVLEFLPATDENRALAE